MEYSCTGIRLRKKQFSEHFELMFNKRFNNVERERDYFWFLVLVFNITINCLILFI